MEFKLSIETRGKQEAQGFAKFPMYPSKAVDTVAKLLGKALEYRPILPKWTCCPPRIME